MEIPEGLKYSKEHEWVLVEGKSATIGITEYAQEELGDIVYVELPEVGEKVVKDDPFGAVESVKAVSDVYAPVSGAVLEVNDVLPDNPETINDDPYGDGWMIRVELSDLDDLKDLMDAEEYAEYVAQQKEEEDDDEEEDEEDSEEEEEKRINNRVDGLYSAHAGRPGTHAADDRRRCDRSTLSACARHAARPRAN